MFRRLWTISYTCGGMGYQYLSARGEGWVCDAQGCCAGGQPTIIYALGPVYQMDLTKVQLTSAGIKLREPRTGHGPSLVEGPAYCP